MGKPVSLQVPRRRSQTLREEVGGAKMQSIRRRKSPMKELTPSNAGMVLLQDQALAGCKGYREKLPPHCPPKTAHDGACNEAYRLVLNTEPRMADFVSHAAMGIRYHRVWTLADGPPARSIPI